ncbi:hypothetical protein [Spiroplasma endosymbiont of Clivina fossor]|uniref:hypothetical protein n=1 Tax=Spiroplasma endosymbiont of Clivina fossor TaxID=3066282 RepID=UPI00313D7B77
MFFKETIGFGIQGLCNKQRVTISSITKLLEKKFVLAVPLQRIVEKSKEINQLILGLAIDKVIVTLFVLEDQIKLNAIKTVAKLKREGIEVYMISVVIMKLLLEELLLVLTITLLIFNH